MKTYSVTFSESIPYKTTEDRWNPETRHWEYDVEVERQDSQFEFHSLSIAKKFIKEHLDKYVSSSIYEVYSDGTFENHGPIKMKGVNTTFTANTRQKIARY